jgi:hypothetical protein
MYTLTNQTHNMANTNTRLPLHAAIAKVQTALHGKFTTTDEVHAGKYSFKYVSLPELLLILTPLLADAGLTAYYVTSVEAGINMLNVQLTHIESGESTTAVWCMGATPSDFKQSGALLTYMYRRLLMGLLGIHPENDESESVKTADAAPQFNAPFAPPPQFSQQPPTQYAPPAQQQYAQPSAQHVASAPPQFNYQQGR